MIEKPKKSIGKYTKQRQSGQISNLEYLLQLNNHASRSFHDIIQYPVFPWILNTFDSQYINLANQKIYRKLKYPIRALCKVSRADQLSKYKQWDDTNISAFHYGTHYSTGGLLTYYLLRVEPFTTQARDLQGGNLDVPERLFSNFQPAWDSCLFQLGDYKESFLKLCTCLRCSLQKRYAFGDQE